MTVNVFVIFERDTQPPNTLYFIHIQDVNGNMASVAGWNVTVWCVWERFLHFQIEWYNKKKWQNMSNDQQLEKVVL